MRISEGLQGRSRRTFTWLLDASEELLQRKTFEAITVKEITDRAGSSVGSFYARFADKEALRDCLLARYYNDLVAATAKLSVSTAWDGKPLSSRAEFFIRSVVETCRRRRGLMRMRFLHDLTCPERISPGDREKMEHFVSGIEKFFRPAMGEIKHPRPKEALSFALRMVDPVLAHTILLEEPAGPSAYRKIADRALVREMTRAFLSYLEARKMKTSA